MKLSELSELISGMISVHGDHEVYHSEGTRAYQHVGGESIFFSEDEEVYYI